MRACWCVNEHGHDTTGSACGRLGEASLLPGVGYQQGVVRRVHGGTPSNIHFAHFLSRSPPLPIRPHPPQESESDEAVLARHCRALVHLEMCVQGLSCPDRTPLLPTRRALLRRELAHWLFGPEPATPQPPAGGLFTGAFSSSARLATAA